MSGAMAAADGVPGRRVCCAACLRPRSACICRWIAPVAPRAALLVLQHPLEAANAKNSARLLHLSVAGSVLAVGEAFGADELDALLHAGGRRPVLLYPETPGETAAAPDDEAAPERLRLVLLDATWRKSRKMLYLNPALQRLPRLALRDVAPSNYRIRKAHAPHQLSSLEAGALALGQLEGDPALAGPLLDAFAGFVEQQAGYVP
ncbi:tRNA-uridine aminocarboxypropyltransferase [Massilia sp. MS-15]|uniref:tRNA-uridine aminocarboxypropyltransferase n=1 Tax=Massilia sp. MS-15 TaxID=2878200 RepID=UPI001CD3BA5C|nr:tRNA-uridine aminocarboxypropyltransferase [Massilia sp. MS-15]MCA1245115.1 DTW domain-containing protein [Massilia sp. MS-15]